MLDLSTADHPQIDGQAERANQVLEDVLRAYIIKRQRNWEDCLPTVEFAYKKAKHVSTGFCPLILLYDFQPRSPIEMGLATRKTHAVKNFLLDHTDMLCTAQQINC